MKDAKADLQSTAEPNPEGTRKKSPMFRRIFWLGFLVLSLAYAWYCFYAPSNDVSWSTGYAEAQQLSVESDKPMVVFFTATWCSPCRIMKRTVWADEQVAIEVNEQFIPLMLYADDPENADVFSRYNVNVTPVTIILDPQGNALDWVTGKVGKEEFLQFIRKSYGVKE